VIIQYEAKTIHMAIKTTGTVQSLERGLRVLECIVASARRLTAAEIASEVGIALPTVYHLLKTLEVADYVGKVSGGYSITTKLIALSAASEAKMAPDQTTIDTMREIASITGETAYTSRWMFGDALVEGVAEASQAVRVAGIHVGLRGHAYARASGRVLLAFGATDMRAYLRGTDFQPLTPKTLVDPGLIEAEVRVVKEQGYAIDLAEFTEGVCCISMPVWGSDGICRAVTVSVPEPRFETNKAHLIDQMSRAIAGAGLSRLA
jgi:IclR family acetate operon transcriptional repressor